MSRRLTDEEIAERYSQQYRVATPEAGVGALFSSGASTAAAAALELPEAFGLSRDYRLAQEAEARRTSQRYYDTNQDAVGSFRNISGVGDVGRYALELGAQSLPSMLPIIGAGLIGGPAAAYGVAGLTGIGAVAQAQREQTGRTDLTAVPLGLAYGGVEAATGIVGKLAGTGVRAERAASVANRYLDNISGFTGGAARTGAAFARTGLSEAVGEVGQEYISNVGRLAIDPRVELFSPEAMEDYAESFVGGGLLGGLLGGAAGGWRRSQGFRDAARERDLTSTFQDQEPLTQRPLESQFVTQDQTVGLQSFINQNVGITRPKRKDYVAQFKAAYDEPTGQFVSDPETGIERPLTVGEALQRSQAALDLTQEKPAEAAATAQVVASTVRDPRSYELRDTFGVIPTPSSLQLYSDIQATGIPVDSELLMDVWKFAGEKPLTPKRLEKAQQLLDAAIIKSRQEAPSGTGVSTVQQPAGGLGVGSPIVQGGVGNAGPAAPVAGTVVGGAPVAGGALQQTSVLPSTPGQPSAPVTTTAPAAALGQPSITGAPSGPQASQTIETAPQGQAAAPIQPAAPAVTEPDIVAQIFGDQDADIVRGFLMGKSSTELAAEAKANGIQGRGEQMIRNKIAGEMAVRNEWPKKIAAAKKKFGYTDEQIRQALEASIAPDADTRSEVEREMNLGRADLYGVRMSETEATEAGLEGSVKSAGAGSSAVQGFTKLQKEIDAMYKRLAAEKDPLVLAWVGNRLTVLQEKVEAFEDREQAKIRAAAGVEETDVGLDDVGEPKETRAKAKAEPKKAKAPAAPVVPVAALDADTKAATDQAKAKWQAANRDLTKLDVADLNLLRNNALRLRNTALADSIAEEIKAKGGEPDAIQVESPAGVSVQPEAEAGEGVGRQVRRAKKPAAEGKAQVPAVILTQAEQAAQAWDVIAADFPQAPKFADLTKAQQENFIGFGEGNWERGDVELELTKLARAAAPAQRVEYPSTAGQQNAPAYLIPSQRAVVDFMNGDITREDLQQKFADLGMTEGQQRSVTNRIEWFPADFAAVKSLVDSGPKLRALRTVFTLDEDNATVELQEQELSRLEAVPGIGAATDRLRKEGLGGLVDYVGGWYTTDSKVNWDGGFTAIDGQAAVLLRRGPMTDSQRVEWTVYHEVGHAADQTHLYGGGVFSSLPVFNVRLEKGQIKPVGAVMKAAFDHYNSNPTSDLSKHLSYPFDRTQHGDLDGDGIREELFAQLWATYTTRDGREFLEDNLPEVADFMEQVYEQVKQTDYAAAKANEAQRSTQAGGQATQGDGQPRQVPLRQTAVRFRASRPQGLIDRNIAKLPKMSQQPVKRITEAIGDLGGKYVDYALFTNDLVKRAQALGLGAAKTFSDRLAARNAKVSEEERKIEKIADRYALIEDANKGDGPGSVNEFLFESTRTGKWGYDTAKFKADPAMKAMFNKLGPKAQQFAKDVFAHGDAMLSSKKTIVLNAANSEYDAMIKAAQDLVNNTTDKKDLKKAKENLAELKAEKVDTLKRFQTLFRIREGVPYAPIKRTGTYAVVAESAAFRAAKENKDAEAIKKMESDPNHYSVSFVDTKWTGRNLKDSLAEAYPNLDINIVKRAEAMDDFSKNALMPALTKMRSAVTSQNTREDGKIDPSAGKLLNIINQLYLEALAEGSARKSEMRRRGVAGEVDMLQSFTQQGRADANFLASVEFEPKIQDALQQMRNQSRTGERERKSEIFDELTQRYADSLDPKPSPFLNGLTNMASKFFLASSPAYYLQNLTQPFMMSLPAMAGRHDYTKAAAELAKAYGELGPLFKDVKLFDQQFDFSKVPADVRAAINDLVNQGKIDIGLATEINEYKVEADGNLSKFAQRLNKGMRMAVQKVEATNRLSTAIAAYRLEFERAKKDPKIADPRAAATQYAADILTDTHGDYTAFNAPRAFNTQWGKVALQFRKFQLIQIAFYAKLIRDAFTKPDERAAAMKTLAYSLGHTAVFAGMMGLPGYAAIAAILGFFGDEDEPYDLTAEMRKAIGPEWADMIMRGAPTLAGMDLSGKIGAGNMLSIMPFSDADLSTNAGRAEALGTLMGGAAFGMTSRIIDGLGLIVSGDYYKGVERVMPKGVSDALKAARQGSEGMTRRNGDVVLPDSEISALDTVFTALGVPVAEQTVTYERQNRMRDLTKNFNDRTTRIKNDYAKAVREKDTAAMQDAREAWTKLQQARQRNGLTPQPVSNLLKAPQEQAQREKRTVGGVQYREGQRKLAEDVVAN